MIRRFRLFIFVPIFTGVVSCGQQNNAQYSSQVVAMVNSDEITVHQLNYELAQKGLKLGENVSEITPGILDGLIDRQLLVQKAIDLKLDRKPDVLRAIENAKSKILAQAYLIKLSDTLDMPSDEEIKQYYDENPGIFAARRIYKYEQLTVLTGKELPGIEKKIQEVSSLGDLTAWLKEIDIEFKMRTFTRPAEKLPAEMVSRMMSMHTGQGALIKTRTGYIIIRLLEFKDAPISLAKARQWINEILTRIKLNKLSKSEVNKLRSNSKITYQGDYKGMGKKVASEQINRNEGTE